MNPLVTFMASTTGRALRVVAGIGLIAGGFFGLGGTEGMILAGVGALPLLTGLLDICLFGPLFGCPIQGAKVRA